MITIVDYGMGNLFSIYNALERVGANPTIIDDPQYLENTQGVIIPGVGAFGRCMEKLSRFQEALIRTRDQGVPILGICIGMQVLFDSSEESPGAQGLGWIPGRVVRLPEGITIPQMGWNSLSLCRPLGLLNGVEEGEMFYFVHSYHCRPEDRGVICATTEHGGEVVAVVARDNVMATQFHPEKSGSKGLRILENLLRMVRC